MRSTQIGLEFQRYGSEWIANLESMMGCSTPRIKRGCTWIEGRFGLSWRYSKRGSNAEVSQKISRNRFPPALQKRRPRPRVPFNKKAPVGRERVPTSHEALSIDRLVDRIRSLVRKLPEGANPAFPDSSVSPLPAQSISLLYFCASPCTGLGYITLKNSATGAMTPYVLVPPGTTVVFNPAQWQSVPVTLGKGTGVTCGQVKP